MSKEITVAGSLQYVNAAQNIPQQLLSFAAAQFDIVGKNFVAGTMAVPTSAGGTAIPLGGLANVGWGMFINRDATNYIELYTLASTGVKFAKLFGGAPGEFCLLRFDPGITAPAALANTAVCIMQYLILEI